MVSRGIPIIAALILALAACAGEPRQMAGKTMLPSSLRTPPMPGLDEVPKLVSGDAPVYPIRSVLNREDGWAKVKFTVATDGNTHDIEVIDASKEIFGVHLKAAVSTWRFDPAMKDGEPVPITIYYESHFEAR